MAGNMEKMGGGSYKGLASRATNAKPSGKPSVDKLRATGKQVSSISGSVAKNQTGNVSPKSKA